LFCCDVLEEMEDEVRTTPFFFNLWSNLMMREGWS